MLANYHYKTGDLNVDYSIVQNKICWRKTDSDVTENIFKSVICMNYRVFNMSDLISERFKINFIFRN